MPARAVAGEQVVDEMPNAWQVRSSRPPAAQQGMRYPADPPTIEEIVT
jgi:hypothetical protein